ncbi:MAG TPA: beta-1,6-N-acetylglucosaminyltransferase [Leptolyngbyaceae cyanobacterium]
MTPTVGFIILTHNKPHQTIRLVTRLNQMFEHPQIVCHHDFSKSDLPVDDLPKNVSLVRPHIKTSWGKFSVVEAMLRGLKLMYEKPVSPDWFILLSGADYPIKPANQILQDLATSPYDVHIKHEQLIYKVKKIGWEETYYERYCSIGFWFPFVDRKLRLIKKRIRFQHPSLTKPFLPFSENLRCFGGEHWFCANRQAAEYLIEFHSTKPTLASHYRKLISPEESYYHTIFCNAPHLKVCRNNWRYIDWSTGDKHPKTLMVKDLPKIHASSAHFARKFDIDADVRILNEIDAIVG